MPVGYALEERIPESVLVNKVVVSSVQSAMCAASVALVAALDRVHLSVRNDCVGMCDEKISMSQHG